MGIPRRIGAWETTGTRMLSPYILPAGVAVLAAHVLIEKDRNWALEIPRQTVAVRVLAYASMILLIASLGASDAAPFIYLQF